MKELSLMPTPWEGMSVSLHRFLLMLDCFLLRFQGLFSGLFSRILVDMGLTMALSARSS